MFFSKTISAICYEVAFQHDLPRGPQSAPSLGEIERFVHGQLARMPRLLAAAVACATALFAMTARLHGLRTFHRQRAHSRSLHWMRWKYSSLRPCRDLARLYESLVVVFLYASEGWSGSEESGL
jgi:hypothetical protein